MSWEKLVKNAHTGLIVVGQDKRIMHSCLAQRNKDLTNFSCFCLVIDHHEFRDSIVKELLDPRGDRQTALTML